MIVTATRRPENVQDVPASIAVVTSDQIDERGLVNAADYLRGIPGVNQVESPFGQSIVIRGLETSPSFQNFSAGTTVATYFGETPTTNSSGLAGGTNIDLKLVDIERVEVLRGPQGTSFGSSSLGGVVRTIPAAPKLGEYEAEVQASYSVTSGSGGENYHVQGIGNLPLIDGKLALRATAYQYDDSGYYRNRAGSDAVFRAAVVTRYGVEAFAVDEEEVGGTYAAGGRLAALFSPTEALKFTVTYAGQKNETDGYPLQNSGHYEQTILRVAPEHVIRGQSTGLFDTDIDLINATMEYDFSWANVLASYSYLEGTSKFVQPGSTSGVLSVFPPRSAVGESEHTERVGELRLTTTLEGDWNFLVGLYGEDLDDEYMSEALWYGSAASNIFRTNFLGNTAQQRSLTQKAAFAEVSWTFVPKATLTIGGRAYDFDRTHARQASGPLFGQANTVQKADAAGSSWRGNLSYHVNDDALIYAGWSQGFRLGKPQAGLSPGVCDLNADGLVDGSSTTIESTRLIDSDEVDSYELGSKLSLLDRRLTIAGDVFRVEWSEVPVRVVAPIPPAGCGLAYTGNVGRARSEGVELQATFLVTPAFRVDIGGSWMQAELTEDALGLIPPAFKGDPLPGSPEVNANLGLQYAFELWGLDASVRTDSVYIGSFYGNLQESANTKSGGYVKVDASARVAISRLSIDLFVRNLTNEDEYTFRETADAGQNFGFRLRPRTIGLQLGYTF